MPTKDSKNAPPGSPGTKSETDEEEDILNSFKFRSSKKEGGLWNKFYSSLRRRKSQKNESDRESELSSQSKSSLVKYIIDLEKVLEENRSQIACLEIGFEEIDERILKINEKGNTVINVNGGQDINITTGERSPIKRKEQKCLPQVQEIQLMLDNVDETLDKYFIILAEIRQDNDKIKEAQRSANVKLEELSHSYSELVHALKKKKVDIPKTMADIYNGVNSRIKDIKLLLHNNSVKSEQEVKLDQVIFKAGLKSLRKWSNPPEEIGAYCLPDAARILHGKLVMKYINTPAELEKCLCELTRAEDYNFSIRRFEDKVAQWIYLWAKRDSSHSDTALKSKLQTLDSNILKEEERKLKRLLQNGRRLTQ